MTAGRLEWSFDGRDWSEQVVDTEECTATSQPTRPWARRANSPRRWAGPTRITTVTDDDGRRNRSELTVWVTGGEGRPQRSVDEEQVTIVPDQETYAPGTTAELFVQAPFAPANGLLTVMRGGIVSATTFDAPDGSAVVEVPIDDALVPNVTVQVDMVGTTARADDGTPLPDVARRPAFATGQIDLSIPPVTRALDVTATPATDAVEPGADTSVTVEVPDPDGARCRTPRWPSSSSTRRCWRSPATSSQTRSTCCTPTCTRRWLSHRRRQRRARPIRSRRWSPTRCDDERGPRRPGRRPPPRMRHHILRESDATMAVRASEKPAPTRSTSATELRRARCLCPRPPSRPAPTARPPSRCRCPTT